MLFETSTIDWPEFQLAIVPLVARLLRPQCFMITKARPRRSSSTWGRHNLSQSKLLCRWSTAGAGARSQHPPQCSHTQEPIQGRSEHLELLRCRATAVNPVAAGVDVSQGAGARHARKAAQSRWTREVASGAMATATGVAARAAGVAGLRSTPVGVVASVVGCQISVMLAHPNRTLNGADIIEVLFEGDEVG